MLPRVLYSILICVALLATASAEGDRFLVRTWQSEDGLPGNVVRGVAQAADGWIWVATAEGVVRFDGMRFTGFVEEPDATLAQRPARALFALPNGDVWISTPRGGLLRWREGRLRVVWKDADAAVSQNDIEHVTTVMPGTWIERGKEMFQVTGGGEPRKVQPSGEIVAALRAASQFQRNLTSSAAGGARLELRDRRGRLWTATPGVGLEVAEGGMPLEMISIPGSAVTALFEDAEGLLWAATGGSGLLQVRPRRVGVIRPGDGLSDRAVGVVLEDRAGALWAGNKGGGLDRIVDGKAMHFRVGEGPDRPVKALCEDRAGTLWAATRNGSVFRRTADEFLLATSSAMPATKVLAMVEDGDGCLWLGGTNGLASWTGSVWSEYGAVEGLTAREVTALAVDAGGRLWVGTGDGFLFHGSGGRFQAAGELGGRAVSALLPEAGGGLWISTLGAGLYQVRDGHLIRFSEGEGLSESRLTSVLDDGRGSLWVGSLAGIFQVAKSSLDEIVAGRVSAAEWRVLDRGDGMLSRECSGGIQPAGWRARSGALWFPTVNGIATIQPEQWEQNRTPPPVVIEEARAGGKRMERGSPELLAGPGRTRLEFRYTALSCVSPEKIRFSLRLEGLEGSAWQGVGPQRAGAFEAVPPGRYRFRVRAANADGIWNEVGASLAVNVRPHFWEKAWFRAGTLALAAAAVLGTGWAIAQARLRGRLMRLEVQTGCERERARIAQDLHDDLGASLTEISLLALLAAEEESPARDRLPEIAAKARGLVGALDEIVWAANPRHDTLASLADYAAAFATEFLENAGIVPRLDLPREIPERALEAEQRHGLFLAVREALNNVVKHAGATEVWLRLRVDAGELRISVEDNGRGLPGNAGVEGDGLRNMRERLAKIGGACYIDSSPAGTRVRFSLAGSGRKGLNLGSSG